MSERLSTAERGYGREHRFARAAFEPLVEAGVQSCHRCGVLIAPKGQPCPRCGRVSCRWDMGHVEGDRETHSGPEHACCNRRAGGRNGGRAAARARRALPRVRGFTDPW